MKLLEGKNTIITGASRGIGNGIAKVFAQNGANVAFTYSSSAGPAEELEKELTAMGVKAKAYKSDASSFEACQDLIKQISEDFDSIDVLVNNAGITKDNLLMRMGEEDFDKVLEVNLKSIFNMTKAVQRTMLKQRHGSIINMSSVVGIKGNAGQANYAASKAGIIGFSKSMALELGSRNNQMLSLNLEIEKLDEKVVAGWRDAIPLKRGGTPEDIANACVFLGSDMSAYVTGQVLQVDGGMLT